MLKFLKYLFFTSPLFFIFTPSVFAKDYSFPQVSFQVWLQSDGSARVEEKRTYRFDGSFHWADEYIKIGKYQITNIQISDENGKYQQSSSQTAGTFFVQDKPDQIYIKWFYSAVDTTKTFTITYTIVDVSRVHQDIAEFYWQLVGGAWEKNVDQVDAVVYLPQKIGFGNSSGEKEGNQKIYGFGHGPLNGRIDIPSKNQVNFSAQNLPQKTFFEVRVLFERGFLEPAYQNRVSDNITLDQILAEEAERVTQFDQFVQLD